MHVPVVVLVAVTVMLADVEGSMDGVGRDEREEEKEPVPLGEGAGVREVLTVGEPDKVAVRVASTQIADVSGERVDVMEPVVSWTPCLCASSRQRRCSLAMATWRHGAERDRGEERARRGGAAACGVDSRRARGRD